MWTKPGTGIALLCVGIALFLAQVSTARIRWPPRRLIAAGSLIAVAGFASVISAAISPALWAS